MFETFPATPEEYEEYCETLKETLPDPPEEIWIDCDDREDRYLDAMYEDRYEISEYGMEGCCGDF